MYRSVILSGLPRSGKSTLVSTLSSELSWPRYGIGDLFRQKWATLREPKEPFEIWWKSRPREEQIAVNYELLEFVKTGQIIADTRYAKFLKDNDGLAIFLTAPLEVRAQRVFQINEYPGKNLRQISDILIAREQAEFEIGMSLFGFDYRKLEDYSLVLDSSKMSVEEEVGAILEELRK